ncbi:hypothetical protein QBC34DRAFT_385575 [Podospora aff. communis PSN243]|uniref:Uncharacterized protein n=1 Tax=Podospora aff. communis PSN243 TaxID=3040156 RepID=A0AAV9G6Z8_9PEZI|nr:hypothetical protein QBC34DRAFT_385575 [Podospora aff. communis PSN243]
MPPRATKPDDPKITLRLKHGIHTIFLFAEPSWTFSKLSAELLEVLRERYPDGLSTTETTTPIPADARVAYAVPRNKEDLTRGWKQVKAEDDDTLAERKLVDLTAVAFALVGAGDEDASVEFVVDVPMPYEDEL